MNNTLTIRERTHDWRNRNKSDSPFRESIVYFSIKDETIMENLMNRRNRPYTEWKKIAKRVLSKEGITFRKLSWRKNAGCSMCPCSPGFIVEGGDIGRDIWIEVTA